MQPEEIEALITQGLDGVEVKVIGDGSHFEATVIGEVFAGKSPVQQQRLVYATVNDRITNGDIHALTIKAYTPDEWAKAQKFSMS